MFLENCFTLLNSPFVRRFNTVCDILKARVTAVTLLLHADWVMLKNASNQGEQTAWLLLHEISAAAAGRFESCSSRKLFGG